MFWGCAPSGRNPATGEPLAAKLVYLGNGICRETAGGLMWTEGKSEAIKSREGARQYASKLQVGGYEDWRLPTQAELFRLHDIFFWKKNGDCLMQVSGSFWYANSNEEAGSGYWETYYLCSPEYKFVETPGKGMVRAVRP